MNGTENWLRQAQYDLETARAMQASGRYLYVLFCCQQAIEKTLKAIIAKQTNEFPPRSHSLMRLAELAGLNMTEDIALLLRELSNYYMQTRYPEEIPAISSRINESQSRLVLTRTEEASQWLLSMI